MNAPECQIFLSVDGRHHRFASSTFLTANLHPTTSPSQRGLPGTSDTFGRSLGVASRLRFSNKPRRRARAGFFRRPIRPSALST